jgi:hypothetical protein
MKKEITMFRKLFPKKTHEIWQEGYEAGQMAAVFANLHDLREKSAYDNAHQVALEAGRRLDHEGSGYQKKFDEVYNFLISKKPTLD